MKSIPKKDILQALSKIDKNKRLTLFDNWKTIYDMVSISLSSADSLSSTAEKLTQLFASVGGADHLRSIFINVEEIKAFLDDIGLHNRGHNAFVQKLKAGFIEYLGIDHLRKIIRDSMNLNFILKCIPKNKRDKFYKDFGLQKIRSLIRTPQQLSDACYRLRGSEKEDFMNKVGKDHVNAIIQDHDGLMVFLENVRSTSRAAIFGTLDSKHLEKIITTGSQLKQVLRKLSLFSGSGSLDENWKIVFKKISPVLEKMARDFSQLKNLMSKSNALEERVRGKIYESLYNTDCLWNLCQASFENFTNVLELMDANPRKSFLSVLNTDKLRKLITDCDQLSGVMEKLQCVEKKSKKWKLDIVSTDQTQRTLLNLLGLDRATEILRAACQDKKSEKEKITRFFEAVSMLNRNHLVNEAICQCEKDANGFRNILGYIIHDNLFGLMDYLVGASNVQPKISELVDFKSLLKGANLTFNPENTDKLPQWVDLGKAIQNSADLSEVLDFIPPAKRYAFVKEVPTRLSFYRGFHRDFTVWSNDLGVISTLVNVVKKFDDEREQVAFLQRFRDKIKEIPFSVFNQQKDRLSFYFPSSEKIDEHEKRKIISLIKAQVYPEHHDSSSSSSQPSLFALHTSYPSSSASLSSFNMSISSSSSSYRPPYSIGSATNPSVPLPYTSYPSNPFSSASLSSFNLSSSSSSSSYRSPYSVSSATNPSVPFPYTSYPSSSSSLLSSSQFNSSSSHFPMSSSLTYAAPFSGPNSFSPASHSSSSSSLHPDTNGHLNPVVSRDPSLDPNSSLSFEEYRHEFAAEPTGEKSVFQKCNRPYGHNDESSWENNENESRGRNSRCAQLLAIDERAFKKGKSGGDKWSEEDTTNFSLFSSYEPSESTSSFSSLSDKNIYSSSTSSFDDITYNKKVGSERGESDQPFGDFLGNDESDSQFGFGQRSDNNTSLSSSNLSFFGYPPTNSEQSSRWSQTSALTPTLTLFGNPNRKRKKSISLFENQEEIIVENGEEQEKQEQEKGKQMKQS